MSDRPPEAADFALPENEPERRAYRSPRLEVFALSKVVRGNGSHPFDSETPGPGEPPPPP